MAYLEEITKYKNMLMRDLCTSTNIVSLLMLNGEPLDPKQLPYKRIFPFEYQPDVEKNSEAYLCFQVSVPRTVSGSIKDVYIDTYAIAEQKIMRTDKGVLVDVLSSEMDKLLNGSLNYGLGKLELVTSDPIWPITTFHGRRNRYRVQDFNRLCGAI